MDRKKNAIDPSESPRTREPFFTEPTEGRSGKYVFRSLAPCTYVVGVKVSEGDVRRVRVVKGIIKTGNSTLATALGRMFPVVE